MVPLSLYKIYPLDPLNTNTLKVYSHTVYSQSATRTNQPQKCLHSVFSKCALKKCTLKVPQLPTPNTYVPIVHSQSAPSKLTSVFSHSLLSKCALSSLSVCSLSLSLSSFLTECVFSQSVLSQRVPPYQNIVFCCSSFVRHTSQRKKSTMHRH